MLGSLSTRRNGGLGPGMTLLLLYNIRMLTECFNWACNVDITHSDSIKHYVGAIGQGAGALSIFEN